jgi:uncharacterized membrane protein
MSRWLWASCFLVVAMLGLAGAATALRADYFPETVAVHWNAAMEPDRFVSRESLFELFWLMPTITGGLLVVLLALPWLSPKSFKVDDFRPIYDYVVLLVIGLMAYLDVVILAGQSRGQLPETWFLGGFFLFFGLIGNVMGKVRKNFWVGIRTPWTLASEVVWERTHRLAAWLFVAVGVGGFVAALLGAPPLWCLIGLVAASVVPVVYSLVLYKRLERAGLLES